MPPRSKNPDGPRALPVFEGWTVDVRLRQFRRAEYGKALEFIPFDSPRGAELLSRWEDSQTAGAETEAASETNDPVGRTYANPDDGNTYYLAPLIAGGEEILWACPTNADGSADFTSSIPETDFAERLSEGKRTRILGALAA